MRGLFPLLVVAMLSGCAEFSTVMKDVERTTAQVLITDEQENQLGLQVHQELQKENVKFLENQQVGLYVESIVKKLTPQATKDRPNVPWKYFVIDDPATINAFATPGGRIYVYSGLLLAAENEAQVVAVLGHEMGHVVGRHSARQLVQQKGVETVTAMALGKASGQVQQWAGAIAGIGGNLGGLAYGREMENEADTYGARYTSGAGYDPRALGTFFEILTQKYGDTPKVMTYLSTHPSNSERIAKVNAYVAANNLRGTKLSPETLKPIQAALGAK